jgi:hypothetical protein
MERACQIVVQSWSFSDQPVSGPNLELVGHLENLLKLWLGRYQEDRNHWAFTWTELNLTILVPIMVFFHQVLSDIEFADDNTTIPLAIAFMTVKDGTKDWEGCYLHINLNRNKVIILSEK